MMMNALLGTGIVSSIFYGLFIDSTYFIIYLSILVPYSIITQVFMKNYADNSKRKCT